MGGPVAPWWRRVFRLGPDAAEQTFDDDLIEDAVRVLSELGVDLDDDDTVGEILTQSLREALPGMSEGLVAALYRRTEA